MKRGYIKLWRKSFDHDFWKEKRPRTKWEAWLDLVAMAAGTDKRVIFRGEFVDLKRGQVLASNRFLSKRWRWDRGTSHRFLRFLLKDGMISYHRSDHRMSIVNILNYDIYNPLKATDTTTERATDATTDTTTDRTTTNKDRIRNKEIKTLWNSFAEKHKLSQIQEIKSGSSRFRNLSARLKEKGFDFSVLLSRIESQPFLLGENKEGWTCDFDFVITASKYQKIMEGSYIHLKTEGETLVGKTPAKEKTETEKRYETARKLEEERLYKKYKHQYDDPSELQEQIKKDMHAFSNRFWEGQEDPY